MRCQALIAYIDSDQRFRFANQPYADRFEKKADELIGKTVSEIFGPANFAKIETHLVAALGGERRVFELVLSLPGKPESESVFKDVTYVPDEHEDGTIKGCYVLAVDVTERKRSELAIADREARLKIATERMSLAMESAGMGSFEWDPNSDIVHWDEQHLAITGLTSHGITTGKMFFDRIHPEDAVVNRRLVDSAVKSKGDYSNEFRFIRPDGEIRWLAARSQVVPSIDGDGYRLIGLNWDITNQKNSVERYRLAEERLRLAAEAAGFGTYQIDLVTGRTHWSPEFKKLVGADDDADQQVPPAQVADFVHPEDRQAVARHLARARDGKDDGIHSFTHRIIMPDGKIRWVKRQGQTILSELDGRPTQIIGTLLDITSQKEIEQSLQEARRIAEAANESKSEFLANMSHEIRTPMSAIMGYTDILSRQLTDPDDLKCASVIRHNGKFLLEIINDILDISKIEAGKLEIQKQRFRVDQLVADVRSLMNVRAAEKGIPLVVEFVSQIPKTIRSDSKRLKQILVNLIGNAIKFTKAGSVQVKVQFVPNDGDTPQMRFDIVDTGIGISVRQLKKLFQPFTQADSSVIRKFEGTGLGLSISQRLARMLGGEITVESSCNVGSIFTLTIETGPVENIMLIEPSMIGSRTTAPLRPKSQLDLRGRILIVDDRRDMRFLAQQMIEDAGATTALATNGRDAIKKIKQAESNGQPFDLIAMDMQMPVLDGYEATRRLRSGGYAKPIIAVTAHAMEGDRNRCIDAGCTDYITKPLDCPKFIAMLAEHLQYRDSSAKQPTQSPSRVLVIDDSKDSCESLRLLLGFNGHQVEVAHDGESGIEVAARLKPSVVLLDLGLPDMSGFEVLKKLRRIKDLQETVFIAATGNNNEAETKSAGFDHHFIKPLDVAKLEQLFEHHATTSLR